MKTSNAAIKPKVKSEYLKIEKSSKGCLSCFSVRINRIIETTAINSAPRMIGWVYPIACPRKIAKKKVTIKTTNSSVPNQSRGALAETGTSFGKLLSPNKIAIIPIGTLIQKI